MVSIKPDLNPAEQLGIRPVGGNRFSAVIAVNVLIAVDYGERSALLDSQIAGAPSIIHTLLPDRFKLNIHKETRQMPVYDLVLASADGRLGPRLRNPPGPCVRVSGALPTAVTSAGASRASSSETRKGSPPPRTYSIRSRSR